MKFRREPTLEDRCLKGIGIEMRLDELTPRVVESVVIFTSAKAFPPIREVRQTNKKQNKQKH